VFICQQRFVCAAIDRNTTQKKGGRGRREEGKDVRCVNGIRGAGYRLFGCNRQGVGAWERNRLA
jgi:hypothetical protein